MENDTIYRQAALDAVEESRRLNHHLDAKAASCHEYEHRHFMKILSELPPAQPEYEELTPEEAASEIASETLMSAWYWLDDLIRLKQMGYAICRKR